MKTITYQIELLEPVLVTSLDGDPNSSVSFDYLPGSVLRGALISGFMQNEEIIELDITDDLTRRLFFDGTTRFLNGYLLDRLGDRSLPSPLSWKQKKKELALQTKKRPAPVFDFAVLRPEDDDDMWKNASKPFYSTINNKVCLTKPERHLTVHTQRDREYGRPMPGSGAVYRYESLAAGQVFEAIILCERNDDTEILNDLLEGKYTLGGSRTGGYGRVKFFDVEIHDTLREGGGALQAPPGEKLMITLLSDALIRDGNGQFVSDAECFARVIGKKLGLTNEAFSILGAFTDRDLIGGFNRKWGLPLPQKAAVKMGSVLVFGPRDWDLTKLQALEDEGVGERRAEGFGRVAINVQQVGKWEVDATRPDDKQIPVSIPENTPGHTLATQMVKRMLRKKLDGEIIRWVNSDSTKYNLEKLSNSQISRLRMILHNALQNTDSTLVRNEQRKRLNKYLETLEKRRTTRDQFKGQKVAGMPLIKWLRERINDEDGLDELDEKNQIKKRGLWGREILKNPIAPVVGDVTIELQPKLGEGETFPERNLRLVYEYNLRLIDAVLEKAAKVRRMQ